MEEGQVLVRKHMVLNWLLLIDNWNSSGVAAWLDSDLSRHTPLRFVNVSTPLSACCNSILRD